MGDLYDRLRKAQVRLDRSEAPMPPHGPGSDPQDPAPDGWVWAAPLVAERTFTFDLEPRFWAAVGPGTEPAEWDNVFCFDTETTGLSGGAGTVPFLIGWAELRPPEGPGAVPRVSVRQWFLRDLPGELDLVASVDRALGEARSLVSFNGASYDWPLLKSRWALAGRELPGLPHRDDLHPARRLWKRLLESCRLGRLEETVLGIRRVGDVPGALVPALWFDYLRAGASANFTLALGGVLSHHAQDVYSLLCLDLLLAALVRDPASPRWVETFGTFPNRPVMARLAPGGLLHPDLGPSTPVDFWGLLDLRTPDSRRPALEQAWDRNPGEPVGLAWARSLKEAGDPRAVVVWTTLWETLRSYPALVELVKWLEHRDRTPDALDRARTLVENALKAPFLPRVWEESLAHRWNRLVRLTAPGP